MGNILAFARDSLTNLVSRMGTSRDKASASYYGYSPLSDVDPDCLQDGVAASEDRRYPGLRQRACMA